jgi:DNA mismatch repair protein MutS2
VRPRDLEVLAFPKVLEALAGLAVSTLGAEACRALRPAADRVAAEAALDRQWTFLRLVETAGSLPLAPFPDVRESLALAEREGAALSGERLVEVRTVLAQVHAVRRFLRGRLGDFPGLAGLPTALHPMPELEAALARALDETGGLHDDASPRLAEIRARLRDLRQQIEERLERLVASSAVADGIADRYVTVRNNRFVVPVKAGATGRIEGVVQDRSTSGETLFVEPLFAIDLNNELLLLHKEEEREELRLLGLLTAQVGTGRHELGVSLQTLATIDRLAAGAAFARRFGCTRPRLAEAAVDLRAARHPELLLAGRPVTPIDLRLSDGKRALIISGPNTGGKTVALKTLGLLTLLAQAGVLIPVEEGSVAPAVAAVFADLADDQSIERNLSTFSSHVVNIGNIFRSLGAPALVLLDEPGGGTDPEEGAALAVGMLDRLIAGGCLVAAATHYAPVKLYALNDPRIELAAADVDPQTFEPRYRLRYGSLGESLGLAMARRLALPDDVLAEAEARRGAAARELGAAIERLESSRRRLEDEQRAIGEERAALAELERERMALVTELRERRRARWQSELEEADRFLRTLKAEGRAVLEIVRRRQPGAVDTLATFVTRATSDIARHAAAVEDAETARDAIPPTLGDEVEVQGSVVRGELIEIQGASARIRRGAVTFQVPLAKLRRLGGPAAPTPPAPRLAAPLVEERAEELHLVGLRVREALSRLEEFLDRAQGRGVGRVRIVHGVGTGALKRAIAEYLTSSSYCTRFADGDASEGGAGVTVAELL